MNGVPVSTVPPRSTTSCASEASNCARSRCHASPPPVKRKSRDTTSALPHAALVAYARRCPLLGQHGFRAEVLQEREHAGRERLADAPDVVRRTLDDDRPQFRIAQQRQRGGGTRRSAADDRDVEFSHSSSLILQLGSSGGTPSHSAIAPSSFMNHASVK